MLSKWRRQTKKNALASPDNEGRANSSLEALSPGDHPSLKLRSKPTNSSRRSFFQLPSKNASTTDTIGGQNKEQPTTAKTAFEIFKIALNALDTASKAIPHAAALSPAIGGVLMVIGVIERKYENEETLQGLADRVDRLEPIMRNLNGKKADLGHFLSKLIRLFEQLSNDAQSAKSQGTLLQFIYSKENASSLEKCARQIDAIIADANLALTADIWDHLKFEDQRRRFKLLNPVHQAAFDSAQRSHSWPCQPGTRREVLENLYAWIELEESKLFWIHGPAGAGKSTIAHTIAEHCRVANTLGATFFFSREEQSRQDGTLLLQTIAYQLGRAYPPLEKEIANVLVDPDVVTRRWQDQLDKLIIQPILKTKALLPPRLVIIIDALDECADKKLVFEVIKAIVTGLRDNTSPSPLRFLVTSRAEFDLYHLLLTPTIYSGTKPFDLCTIDPADANNDIRIFFTEKLKELYNPDSNWPSSEDIDFLVDISEGLFIAASTVLRFLDSPRYSPKACYQKLRSEKKVSGLESMYSQILSSAMSDIKSPEEKYHFKAVVGTIILASTRLSVQALGDLLGIEVENDLKPILTTLRPVIYVPESNDEAVHTFHSSFHDYLIDPKRCTNNDFFVDPIEHHGELAHLCLTAMVIRLPNVCGFRLRNKRTDREVRKSLGGDMIYACRYWGGHIDKSNQVKRLTVDLDKFASECLLFWIEVLSAVNDLIGGVKSLQAVTRNPSLLKSHSKNTMILLSDAIDFLVNFYDYLTLSSIHTYATALPLSPKNSALYKHYGIKLGFASRAITYHETEWRRIER